MDRPLLSICIATYNRAAFIGETLESIIPQLTDEVEIVITDGASNDNTADIVKNLANEHNQIKYFQLPIKGGVDQDYCKAVEFARGDMCWLFTDDDLIKPGAIRRILKEIDNGYSLIVMNAETKSIDFSKLLRKSELKITEDKVLDSSQFDELFQLVIPYLSFIGGVVMNRKLWLERNKAEYFGTEFIHVGVIFQLPLPSKALVVSTPYITIRWGNAQWTSRSFEIWMIKWPNLLSSFGHLSERTRHQNSMSPSFNWLKQMLYHRKQGAFSKNQYRLWLISGKQLPLWWKVTVKAISLIPVPFARLIINAYSGLKSKS